MVTAMLTLDKGAIRSFEGSGHRSGSQLHGHDDDERREKVMDGVERGDSRRQGDRHTAIARSDTNFGYQQQRREFATGGRLVETPGTAKIDLQCSPAVL